MRYRTLGRTGLLVSEICFGTMTFGGEGFWEAIGNQSQAEADRLVGRVLEAGVNFIDTANVYSEGASERILGRALGERRKEVVLATKVRGRMGEGPNQVGLTRRHIIESCEASLRRLGTDWIDLYQIHGVDPLTPIDETLGALDDLIRQGKVRYAGCSNLPAWQIMKGLGISKRRNLARFESLQAFYTAADRDLERELIPLLNDQTLGLMVWSPLSGGLLTGKFQREGEGPKGARRTEFDFPPTDRERTFDVVDVLRDLAPDHGGSVARLALAWLLHQEPVTSVIIGARTMEQLEDNLKATDVDFSEEELARIDEAGKPAPTYPGWMIERQFDDRLPGGSL